MTSPGGWGSCGARRRRHECAERQKRKKQTGSSTTTADLLWTWILTTEEPSWTVATNALCKGMYNLGNNYSREMQPSLLLLGFKEQAEHFNKLLTFFLPPLGQTCACFFSFLWCCICMSPGYQCDSPSFHRCECCCRLWHSRTFANGVNVS